MQRASPALGTPSHAGAQQSAVPCWYVSVPQYSSPLYPPLVGGLSGQDVLPQPDQTALYLDVKLAPTLPPQPWQPRPW